VLVALTPHILPLVGRNLALAGILADRSHLVKDAFSTLKLIREQREGDWVSLWYCR
jgi:ribosomal protein L11 methylase PrmA